MGGLFVFTENRYRLISSSYVTQEEAKSFSDSSVLHFGGLDILACF